MMISLEEFKNKFNSLKKRIIKSRFSNIIEKGKKGADIGTIKDYMIGGKLVKYIKTPTGWKPYGTGKVKMKKPEEVHEPRIKKPEEVHEPRERKSKEEIEKQRNKQIENYASKATDKQLNAAINDPKQKEEIKEFARKELEKRGKSQNSENKVVKQITQTYVKVSDGQIIVKMNKDKTHYKATKGGFKLESKDGEDIGDFKQRIKSEYEKFSTDSGQQKEKVVSLQQENREDMNKDSKEIKQITQTYLKVSDGQFIIKMNKDKTGYKATKGSLKFESKEGEGIVDFKKRLKEEYEKSQKENKTQREYKQFKNEEDVIKYQRDRVKISKTYEFVSKEKINELMNIKTDITSFVDAEDLVADFKEDNLTAKDILENYTTCKDSERIILNQKLIQEGFLPVVNGTLYSSYKGEDYLHYNMYDYTSQQEGKRYYEKEGEKNIEKATDLQKTSLQLYMGDLYSDIRLYNEKGITPEESFVTKDEIKGYSDAISEYIDKNRISDNLVLNRRMSLEDYDYNNPNINKWIQAEVGDVLEDKSFSSFSLKQLSDFGSNLQITLLAKKGQAISNINNDLKEYEYLTQKGSKFKVIDRGLNSIVVELID